MIAVAIMLAIPVATGSATEYTMRPVTKGMWVPWEMRLGPDQMLWTTERNGRISRVHPETGERTVLLDHSEQTGDYGEGGMLGLCHHPDFPDSPFVYVTINYAVNWRASYRTLERWTYDSVSQKLTDRRELRRFSPTAWAHQGGRLAFGTDRKLYMTTGENGDMQWAAQSDTSALGKVLRFNSDGSIPADNPIPGNPMWCKGLRNPQGLLIMEDGRIFTSEHGVAIEDEINLIRKGGNYGWPEVEGPCDEPWEQAFCDSVKPIDPFFSSGTVTTWAMSDMAYYNHDRFPELKNAILLATLRHNSLYVLHLNAARDRVDSVTRLLHYSVGRLRDIAVTPDGRIFLSTSNNGDLYAVDPFPIENDDHIYELLHLPPGSPTTLVGPADTVRMTSFEKEHVFLTTTVTNTGTTPTTITEIVQMTPGPVDDSHWNQPFIIMPGVSYTIHLQYRPWDFGVHDGHLRLVSDNSNDVDIYVQGTSLPARPYPFTLRSVTSNLQRPYEIQWGVDQAIWSTESEGVVRRTDPETGASSVILDLRSSVVTEGEGGLHGMALHPSFADSPYVYLAVTRQSAPDPAYRAIERWRYDMAAKVLTGSQEIFRLAPSSTAHQGCRLAFGADGMLYVTSGDLDAENSAAQSPDRPYGKLLRLRPDGSIPSDNPIPGNPLWSLGHRDPHGLAVLPDGTIYSTEIGDGGTDEVNVIKRGANYGWPVVQGPCDEPSEQEFCDSVKPTAPLYHSAATGSDGYSDVVLYGSDRYPSFANSLLVATLDRSSLVQMQLSEDGTAVDSVVPWFINGVGRVRDVLVSPDGRVFFCTSNRDPQARAPFPLPTDDHIYEVIPVGEVTNAILQGPDTVSVNGVVGQTQTVRAMVSNIGPAPTLISELERIPADAPIEPVPSQTPFVIMPGMDYPIEVLYRPLTAGQHDGVIRLHSDHSLSLDLFVKGFATVSSVDLQPAHEALSVIPQPFTATVRISLPETLGAAAVRIMDLEGQEVWSTATKGSHVLMWDGRDKSGYTVVPGTYVLVATDGRSTYRALIVRVSP